MSTLFLILAVLSAAACYLANRIEHGIIYYYHRAVRLLKDGYLAPVMPARIEWWDRAVFLRIRGIHKSGNLQHYGLSACLFFSLLAGQGISGVMGWKGYAAAAFLAYLPFLLADPLGQQLINDGSDNYDDEPEWWRIPLAVFVILTYLAWRLS